ncbi:hypothetical protein HS1genome_2151 [Sulfodiicoccus acidiphilus]|uniref:DoxX family protein n=1 Tax=Sulfodiicoccus acidiphilus TaxID=1670455 RepID=A0A348B6G0_9CREN|nr:DoxX family membrane protein [Sulfodiicoccus acidiphilus]BBD73762.1 hypothetical protein HS1genome_2151 [Sulfodiicoccus acidiphilus]GGT98159.1 hypothetical protein GCM10007116_14670 [Sulfodiicoccus acidiphilus]
MSQVAGLSVSIGLLLFRLLYAFSLIPHSFSKLNRTGNRQMKDFMKQIGIHPVFVDLSMLTELLGGLLVLIGTLNLLVSVVLIIFFVGTIVASLTKMKKPMASGTGLGVDLDLLFLAGALLLLFTGPGTISLLQGPTLSSLIG